VYVTLNLGPEKIENADMRSVDDPYMSLIHFADPDEQETVLGPLFATAAKANVAVFGPDKFITTKAKQRMVTEIKAAIHSGKDPVVELLAPSRPFTGDVTADDHKIRAFESSMSKLGLAKSRTGKAKVIPNDILDDAKIASSSREMHQKMHNSIVSLAPTAKAQGETRDNIMLRRAIDGYLFDCTKNVALLKNDQWLQEAWLWVKSMFRYSYY
jgi:hypothetical protein